MLSIRRIKKILQLVTQHLSNGDAKRLANADSMRTVSFFGNILRPVLEKKLLVGELA